MSERFHLCLNGLSQDREDIKAALSALPASEAEKTEAEIREKVRAFLTEHESTILKLAQALLKRQRLDAETAKSVYSFRLRSVRQ